MSARQSTLTISKRKTKELSANELLPLNDFLKKYKIDRKEYDKTGLTWSNLKEIFYHYSAIRIKLEHPATAIVNIFLSKEAKDQGVHSVRYRLKDPNSLIEKIIRKKIKSNKLDVNISNYMHKITDLIGIRILHPFKLDWYPIHNYIRKTFSLKKGTKPIIYYKEDDEPEFIKLCEKMGCKQKKHPIGYRSVHYVVSTQLTKETYFAEIQVRTIFEEGWSEIDHKIRYTFKGHTMSPFENELRTLNRTAGSADDIGNIIKRLQQQEQERILKPKSLKRKR